jgi:AcrR family transcriptional regulator
MADEAREPLTRERVLGAAIGLADAHGLGALTMRRLAGSLGVEAMSLYHHVANKDAILAGIGELVVDEMELPRPGEPWREEIRRAARSAFGVLARHPWAAGLLLSGAGGGDARFRWMDAVLGTFRRDGFSAGLTDRAYHAVDSHIMGFALWLAGMNLGSDEEVAALAGRFLETLPRDRLPYLVEHVEQHMRPRDPADEGEFAWTLDLLLDGLERLRDQR